MGRIFKFFPNETFQCKKILSQSVTRFGNSQWVMGVPFFLFFLQPLTTVFAMTMLHFLSLEGLEKGGNEKLNILP
jgi:hypothetical protein